MARSPPRRHGRAPAHRCRRPARRRLGPRGRREPDPEAERTEEQRTAAALAAQLVDELVAADAVLLAVPLYNYGVSQHVKTWVDLIISDPRAAAGAPPFLAGTKVVLCTVRAVPTARAPARGLGPRDLLPASHRRRRLGRRPHRRRA
ncbi:NAD(P)H-dependent oxidoreductase [Janibacter melonis]|uniref:NAD(P)H-dependent oxidoreductase n=1 Tax=Janibacter melonis TaxID=262209 RepID=UPI00209479EB|nr:NAD(P)H-dependent oxidoreductase [Janibacter melonis]